MHDFWSGFQVHRLNEIITFSNKKSAFFLYDQLLTEM